MYLRKNMGMRNNFVGKLMMLTASAFITLQGVHAYPPPPPLSSGLRESYDFIVVGSGTCGSTVGGRLSESGHHSVLLLEAGGEPHPGLDVPALVPYYLVDQTYTKLYRTVPQRNAALGDNGTVTYMVGRTLGGGSSINGMVWNRGNPRDFNLWAKMTGDNSWSYSEMMKYFLKSEDYNGDFPSDQHGYGGPISITRPKFAPGLETIYSAGRALGYPISDTNGPQRPTFAPTEFNKRRGRRVSSYTGYIKPYLRSRPNLKVTTRAIVKRIVFEGNKAVGVIYTSNSTGRPQQDFFIRAKKEIVISAGALESPTLLLKSGIGRKDVLRENGIPPVEILPVGKNLQDHVGVRLEFIINDRSPEQVFIAERELTPEAFALYNRTGEGPYSTYDGLHSNAMISSTQAISQGNGEWPDLQIEFVSGPGRSDVPGLVGSASGEVDGGTGDLADWETSVFCIVFVTRPKSLGTINLNPENIDADPVIDFQYLSHPEDMDVMVDGIKRAMQVYENTPVFRRLGARYRAQDIPACSGLHFRSDAYWRCFIRQTAAGGLRGTGSCRMGSGPEDPNAVVDTQLRVIGVQNLRVADGSIMPKITNSNTDAPIYAIGEKAADMILQSWEESAEEESAEEEAEEHHEIQNVVTGGWDSSSEDCNNVGTRESPRWGRKGPYIPTNNPVLG